MCVYSPLAPVLLSVDLRNITQDRLLYRLSTYRLFLIGNFCDDPFIFIVKMLVKCILKYALGTKGLIIYMNVCVYIDNIVRLSFLYHYSLKSLHICENCVKSCVTVYSEKWSYFLIIAHDCKQRTGCICRATCFCSWLWWFYKLLINYNEILCCCA